MGSNNNQSSSSSGGYGPNANPSGSDPKGVGQNQSQYQQQRYESQQGPMVNAFATNYGQGSAQNIGDYTDIMNNYRAIATGSGTGGTSGGGGGYDVGGYTPFTVSYDDPFQSYGGFTNMSQTGGYSDADMANLRARAASPVRAAYAAAQQGIQQQRSLQGGYSPNAVAAQVKMARDQGQSASDAIQNAEAGIISARNQNELAGLTGMSGIEGQRLGAQIDVGKFNATAQQQAQSANIGAAAAANAAAAAASQNDIRNRLSALGGMTSLYGTTPGMSATFGSQLENAVQGGGQFGNTLYANDIRNQQAPGAFNQTMGQLGQIGGMVGTGVTTMANYLNSRNNQPTNTNPYGITFPTSGNPNGAVSAPGDYGAGGSYYNYPDGYDDGQ